MDYFSHHQSFTVAVTVAVLLPLKPSLEPRQMKMKQLAFCYITRRKLLTGILEIYVDIESNICLVCRGTLYSKIYALGARSSLLFIWPPECGN